MKHRKKRDDGEESVIIKELWDPVRCANTGVLAQMAHPQVCLLHLGVYHPGGDIVVVGELLPWLGHIKSRGSVC
jgi:hypothetical protein